jgi:plasmid stabilization system protein ParE
MAGRSAIWSPEALLDLDEIRDYYARVAGRNTAEKIVRNIGEIIAMIEDHPFAGRSRNEVRPGLRSLAAAPHVVFYRVINEFRRLFAFWIAEGTSRRFSQLERRLWRLGASQRHAIHRSDRR